jgi:adenine-specific DNA glycosylase
MIKGVLFQESLHRDPFWMLVACQLVNRTKWQQAEPVFHDLRRRYPGVIDVANAEKEGVVRLVKPLGLYNRRAQSLIDMANAFVVLQPRTASEVKQLPGCGQYAMDSWAIFVDRKSLKDFDEVALARMDVELRTWLEDGGYVDQNGVHSGRTGLQ